MGPEQSGVPGSLIKCGEFPSRDSNGLLHAFATEVGLAFHHGQPCDQKRASLLSHSGLQRDIFEKLFFFTRKKYKRTVPVVFFYLFTAPLL